jgi:hypothetical protein
MTPSDELDVERVARLLFAADPKWHGPWSDLLTEDMEIFRDRARSILNEGGVAPEQVGEVPR